MDAVCITVLTWLTTVYVSSTNLAAKMSGFHDNPTVLLAALYVWYALLFVTVTGMLPFGTSSGDANLTSSRSSSPSLPLSVNFTFFGETHSDIFANVDGVVTFGSGARFYDLIGDFGTLDRAVVCIFCAKPMPSGGQNAWYRLSTDAADIQAVEDVARQYDDFGPSYTPTWVLVVTWDDVEFPFNPPPGNTMQAVVASDGARSFVLYEYDAISWVDFFVPYLRTKVGFDKGNTTSSFYAFPESHTGNLTRLNSTSNIGDPGLFLFRVDQATIASSPTRITTTTPTTVVTTTPGAAETTAPPTTTSANGGPASQHADDDEMDYVPYAIGFGVAGGVLAVVATAVAVYYVLTKTPKPPSKVSPLPSHTTANGHANGPPPRETARQPFRIPRPSYDIHPNTTVT